jgi:hypothetical protein
VAAKGRSHLTWIVPLLLVLAGGVGVAIYAGVGTMPGAGGIREELAGRDKVLLLGDETLVRLAPRQSAIVRVFEAGPAIAAALDGDDPAALVDAIVGGGFDAILIDGREPPASTAALGDKLRAYAHVPGLRATLLTPAAAVYRLDEVEALEGSHAEAMGHVARSIIEGARPPRVSSFPEPLRRLRNVEVMVLLRERGQARLWRSARGSSLARALVTAAVVARQRWEEREQAMGGPLDEALPNITVEVVRLSEDGTLGARSESFVERVFTPEHGVAYERRGTWHYQLPGTRPDEPGAAYAAYVELFTDNGLEPEAISRSDIRPYRLVATPLAVSGPGADDSDEGSPFGDPLSLDAGLPGDDS